MARELISRLSLVAGPRVWIAGAQNHHETTQNKTHCRCRFTLRLGERVRRSGAPFALDGARIVYDRSLFERYKMLTTRVDSIDGVPFNEYVYFQDRFGTRIDNGELPFATSLGANEATFYGWSLVDELDGKSFRAIVDASYDAPPRAERSYLDGSLDDTDDWLALTYDTITWRRVQ